MQCPVCRAVNDQGPQCRRCRADLSLLFQLEDQRDQARSEALHCLSTGQMAKALIAAERMDHLAHDDESRRLLAVIHLLRREFDRAWRSYMAAE